MNHHPLEFLEFQIHFAKVVDFVGDSNDKFLDDFGKKRGRRCTVLLKGRTLEGKSVLLRVKGFSPWFYVLDDNTNAENPPQLGGSGIDKGRVFLKEMNVNLSNWNYKYDINYQVERRRLGDGCEPNPADGGATILRRLVYKIMCPTMKLRKAAIEKLKHRHLAEDDDQCSALVQFYSSTGMRPMSWVRVNLSKAKRYPTGTLTWCTDYELRSEIEHVQVTTEKSAIAPFRVIVMDIEADSMDGSFPDPHRDKAIIIGTRQKIFNSADPQEKGIQFCLGEAPPDPENRFELRCFENESMMYSAYANYIKMEFDTDAIVTWNGRGFDHYFNFVRVSKFPPSVQDVFYQFSVLKNDKCVLKEKQSSKSKQSDKRNNYLWKNLFGRLDLDLMISVKQDVTEKHRSYSLNYISKVLLGDQKEDLSPQKLWSNHRSGGEGRLENCIYCDKDCYLPLRIMEKKKTLVTLMQLAYVCYTEMDDLITKGQTIKVWNMIHAYGYIFGFVINHVDIPQPQGYQGAYVLPPKRGLHIRPISILDFKSLYPSLMIEHNLCYSTECQTEMSKNMPNARYDRPHIDCEDGSLLCPVFYQNELGLLPMILKDLLHERENSKKEMEAAKNSDEIGVLNGRQLALKVSANSVYGFTGATMAKMPRLTISATVTYYGRLGLLKTQNLVESKYSQDYCYKTVLKKDVPAACKQWLTEVVGGDTDSVFVSFPVPGDRQGLLDSIQIAKVAAAECTTTFFKDPMELEYENTYLPLFIKEKKRYVAGKYVTGHEVLEDMPEEKWQQAISVKGLEMVRRDVPPFTSNLMKHVTIKLFIHRDITGAYQIMTQQMDRFCNRQIDIMELIMSGQLGDIDDYANPESLAHVNVVKKMKLRNPGSEPRTGDRVLYVYIKNNTSNKAADKAEDIGFVRDHKLDLDLEYYYDHKIYKPLIQLFEAVDPHVDLRFQTWRQYVISKNRGHGSVLNDLKKVRVTNNGPVCNNNKSPTPMVKTPTMEFKAVEIQRKRKRSEIQNDIELKIDRNSLTNMFGKSTLDQSSSSSSSIMPITSSVKKNTRVRKSKAVVEEAITQNLDRSSLFGCCIGGNKKT